jgi:hypothetical protein
MVVRMSPPTGRGTDGAPKTRPPLAVAASSSLRAVPGYGR